VGAALQADGAPKHQGEKRARGVLKKELLRHLRSKRTIRRSRQAGLHKGGRGQIVDPVSIARSGHCNLFDHVVSELLELPRYF
jgi:hypothetical protein